MREIQVNRFQLVEFFIVNDANNIYPHLQTNKLGISLHKIHLYVDGDYTPISSDYVANVLPELVTSIERIFYQKKLCSN